MPFVFSSLLPGFIQNPFGPDSLSHLGKILLAFFGFSFLASAGYILNDWKDIELDRLDPKKKHRPMASGAINPSVGFAFALVLLCLSFYMAFLLAWSVVFIFATYLCFNILFYSFLGKNIILMDVFTIAVGFVLRVLVGGFALDIEVSNYLISCTFFIALFLGFSKRYYEVRNGPSEVLKGGVYQIESLSSFINISATLAIVNFTIYTIEGIHKGAHLIYTVPLVVLGIFRYYVITHSADESGEGNPSDVLISDKFLIGTILIWLVACAVLILAYPPVTG